MLNKVKLENEFHDNGPPTIVSKEILELDIADDELEGSGRRCFGTQKG